MPAASAAEAPAAAQYGENYFLRRQYDQGLDRLRPAQYVQCRDRMEREANPTAVIIDR
jgi:hypothetical protein